MRIWAGSNMMKEETTKMSNPLEYLPGADELAPEPRTPIPTETALALVPPGPVSGPLSISQLHDQLEFIRAVMQREMREGTDYGTIPGCGDRPTLLQPGAQKLCLTFQFDVLVKSEVLRPIPHPTVIGHREYDFSIVLRSRNGREWNGVGTCNTMETKYRYRAGTRKCPECGKETIIKGKAEYGGGWLCFTKKGGCGHKWPDGSPEIESQSVERQEHDNPADYWNTVRKMAFKRAHVHASIIATNSSELWTQDIEDIPGEVDVSPPKAASAKPAAAQTSATTLSGTAPPSNLPPASSANPPTEANANVRAAILDWLGAVEEGPQRNLLHKYLVAIHWLDNDKVVNQWPGRLLPITPEERLALKAALDKFEETEIAIPPYQPHGRDAASLQATPVNPPKAVPAAPTADVPAPPCEPAWKAFAMPFGKSKGKRLGQFPPAELKFYVEQFRVREAVEVGQADGSTVRQPLPPESIASQKLLRAALDAARDFVNQPATKG